MIPIKIKKNSGEALYVQIRNTIEKAIKKGELKAGEQLPAVTTLAGNIGVTHSTIRRAFKDLSAQGLIGSHVGRGTLFWTGVNRHQRKKLMKRGKALSQTQG
jgi:DNA-binding transcriptional regulator YhcF (GntR family)